MECRKIQNVKSAVRYDKKFKRQAKLDLSLKINAIHEMSVACSQFTIFWEHKLNAFLLRMSCYFELRWVIAQVNSGILAANQLKFM